LTSIDNPGIDNNITKQNFFNNELIDGCNWVSTSLNHGKFLKIIPDIKQPTIGGTLRTVHNGCFWYPNILNPISNLTNIPPIVAVI